jgi:asparagine synthase (glutamine-hydrolysing)
VDAQLKAQARYFSPDEWEVQEPLDPSSFLEEFEGVFKSVASQYVPSDERIGMSLTGGLDGRMIMASVTPESGRIPCYTFSGMNGEIVDARIARQVAAVCGQPHVVLPIAGEFFKNFAAYAEKTVYISDGTHGVGGAHDLYLNERATTIAPVRLSGKFGSEIVRGVRHLRVRPLSAQLFDRNFYAEVHATESRVARLNQSHPVTAAAFVELPWWHYGCLTIEQSQVTFVTPFVDNRLVELMYRRGSLFASPHRIPWYVIARHRPALLAIETDRGVGPGPLTPWRRWRALRGYLSFKADWVFTEKPQAYARAVSMLETCGVDRIFNGRHILAQYRRWFQRECRDFVLDVLLDPRTRQRAFWNAQSLQRIVAGHLAGSGSYVHELDKALSAELIHRHLLETD